MGMRRRSRPDPECQLFHRVLNEWRDITYLVRPGTKGGPRSTVGICASGGCWDKARELGYR